MILPTPTNLSPTNMSPTNSSATNSSATDIPSFETPLLKPFLAAVDRLADALGVSVPPIVNLTDLRQLPSGTFGRALADALDRARLDPFTTGPRRKQLHDSIHVLTGYGTDAIGEVELQAFMLGAKFHLAHMILGMSILRIMHRRVTAFPLTQPQIRQRLWAAYQRGQQSRFDVDAWQPETEWALSLEQVRIQQGL